MGGRSQEFPEPLAAQAWLQGRQQPAGLFVFWWTLKNSEFIYATDRVPGSFSVCSPCQ